ncbi:MAG: protein phosphatase CheZ [Azospirillaceae bacterium]|nr:protein phosphatase CheZ [Azospirillaceae bacterium]
MMSVSDFFSDLSDEEYARIEDALQSTARGRAFLRMRDRRGRVVAIDDVRRLLKEAKTGGEADGSGAHIRILRRELQEMASHIAQTRREIAALKPDDPSANRIMLATEELDAILQATEHATTEILNGAERIQTVADRLRGESPAVASELDNEVMEIMTACSFQDITGQRMTKVVNTMRYIERRVHTMIEIWGLESEAADAIMDDQDVRPDAHLMHGPALHGGGIDQNMVDALMDGGAMPAAAPPPPPPPEPTPVAAPVPVAPPPPPPPKAEKKPAKPPEAPSTDGKLSQSAVDDMFP